LTSKMSIAQKELKQQWYLQFHAAQKPVLDIGIWAQKTQTDRLGNTFISFTSYSTVEFQGKTDTGTKVHLIKVDKKGKVLWSKLFRMGFETSNGSITDMCPDNKGGVFIATILGSYYKLSDDSTFKGPTYSNGLIHWDENGTFKTLTYMDRAGIGFLEYGLDGKLYLKRDDHTLHVINENGKLKTSYFPYDNYGLGVYLSVNKLGDVANLLIIPPYDYFVVGDSIYKGGNNYSYGLTVKDSTGKLKWHKFYKNRSLLDYGSNKYLQWDNQNNLFVSLNLNHGSPGYEEYLLYGKKAIIYSYDEFGKLKGEFFDKTYLEFEEFRSEAFLQLDEDGRVSTTIINSRGNAALYPGLVLKKEEYSPYLRIKFNDSCKVEKYYTLYSGGGHMGVAQMATKGIFSNIRFLRSDTVSKEYYLPNRQIVNCKYNSDFFVIMMDTTEPPKTISKRNFEKDISVKLEPNPIQLNAILTINSQMLPIESVSIIDVKGTVLKELAQIQLSQTPIVLDQKSGFKAGIYYVRIQLSDGRITTQKIVVTD